MNLAEGSKLRSWPVEALRHHSIRVCTLKMFVVLMSARSINPQPVAVVEVPWLARSTVKTDMLFAVQDRLIMCHSSKCMGVFGPAREASQRIVPGLGMVESDS